MYKTRNTGTVNEMRGTRGIGECYIPGNVAKHFGECPKIFRGMSPNIPGNAAKHSEKCRQIFRGMSPSIPGNVLEKSREYSKIICDIL